MVDDVKNLMEELAKSMAEIGAKKRASEEASKKAQEAVVDYDKCVEKVRSLQNELNTLVSSQINPVDSRVKQSA